LENRPNPDEYTKKERRNSLPFS